MLDLDSFSALQTIQPPPGAADGRHAESGAWHEGTGSTHAGLVEAGQRGEKTRNRLYQIRLLIISTATSKITEPRAGQCHGRREPAEHGQGIKRHGAAAGGGGRPVGLGAGLLWPAHLLCHVRVYPAVEWMSLFCGEYATVYYRFTEECCATSVSVTFPCHSRFCCSALYFVA